MPKLKIMDKVKIIGMSLLFFCLNLLSGQSPYDLNWQKESILLGSGLTSVGTGLLIHFNIDTYSEKDIAGFDRSVVSSFDVRATYNLSIPASKASDILLISSHLTPMLFMAKEETRKDFGKIMVLYGETILLTDGLTILSKRLAKRPRPFVFNEQANLSLKLTRQAKYAFFSGHTSITSANYFFFAKVFSDYYPNSKLKPFIWGTAATVPAVVGFLRVKAGKHYPSDVMVGYAVGALIGYFIPHLHKVDRNHRIKLRPKKNSIVLTYKF